MAVPYTSTGCADSTPHLLCASAAHATEDISFPLPDTRRYTLSLTIESADTLADFSVNRSAAPDMAAAALLKRLLK